MNSILLVVIVVVAIILIGSFILSRRSSRLRPLSEESRSQYALEWQSIEARFVDEPQEAVRAADVLVMKLIRERGGREDRLPKGVGKARAAVADHHGGSLTENLRQAMIGYRKAVGDLIGTDPRESRSTVKEISS
jgi:hypothetical protein